MVFLDHGSEISRSKMDSGTVFYATYLSNGSYSMTDGDTAAKKPDGSWYVIPDSASATTRLCRVESGTVGAGDCHPVSVRDDGMVESQYTRTEILYRRVAK